MVSHASLLGLAVALAAGTGCAPFPTLDRTITPEIEAADYPALVPLDPLLARTAAPRADPDRSQAELNARVSALRARAAQLRESGISGRERQRLADGLQ